MVVGWFRRARWHVWSLIDRVACRAAAFTWARQMAAFRALLPEPPVVIPAQRTERRLSGAQREQVAAAEALADEQHWSSSFPLSERTRALLRDWERASAHDDHA